MFSTLRTLVWFTLAAAAAGSALATPVADADSAGIDMLSWARLQGRITLATPVSALRSNPLDLTPSPSQHLGSASLMGDYYLGRPPQALSLSGFRATGGLLIGQRTSLWGQAEPTSPWAVDQRWSGNEARADSRTPYLGLGYTSLSSRSGWRFSADLGLMSLSPGNILRLGRVVNGGDNLGDMVRDLRFSQVLQLGVSYAF